MRRRGRRVFAPNMTQAAADGIRARKEDLSAYRKDHPEVFLSLRKPIDERGTVLPTMTR